ASGARSYGGSDASDESITDKARVTLPLHSPEAGVTAGGAVFRFGPSGKLPARPEDGMAASTLDLVDAAAHPTKTGMSLEVAIPARALPRFPARDDLLLEMCLAYEDVDAADAQPQKEISSCATG